MLLEKPIDVFSKPSNTTQIGLILSMIYSLFQQKTHKKYVYTSGHTCSWKSADAAKTNSNFEKEIQNINPR